MKTIAEYKKEYIDNKYFKTRRLPTIFRCCVIKNKVFREYLYNRW
jgi:hypothetical protein